ncbi:ligase, partial [Streptomonospora salina]
AAAGASPARPDPAGAAESAPARLLHRLLRPGWPVLWLLAGYPLWWALGLGRFAFVVFAVPMAVALVRRHRTVGLRLPPGFGLWALFLLWCAAGLTLVGATPAGTVPGSGGPAGALARLAGYLALTVLLLYVGNLGRRELSDTDVARALGWLCLATVAGGLLGLAAPRFEFTSPMELLLPAGLAAHPYVQDLIHPASSQVMEVLGYESARPKAPWEYTNTWGNMLSLLLVWLVAGWMGAREPAAGRAGAARRSRADRVRVCIAVAAIAAAAVPVVYSLNRAVWAGLALSSAFVLLQLLRRGNAAAVAATGAAAAAALLAVLLSPLTDVVHERLDSPHSDGGRAASSAAAVRAANASPVVGWGTTRDMAGSPQSIAIGPSPDCPDCGNHTIGNNGQFWLLLVANGWVGAALFLAFFAQALWRYRHATSVTGSAALLSILLLLWYMFFYVALAAPLAVTMIGVALLWRRSAGAGGASAVPGGAR